MSRKPARGLRTDADGVARCWWCGDDPLYVRYHDAEWGFPVADDVRLFEKLCLEGFQAGLAWITILRKRENFREAFQGFDPERVAGFTARDVNRLLRNEGIIRHRGKIEAAINNARRTIELIEQAGSLAAYIWRFEPAATKSPKKNTRAAMPASTRESSDLSKDLRRRGFKFVGPTTAYAFMQAMGLVNDHITGCATGEKVRIARSTFRPPD